MIDPILVIGVAAVVVIVGYFIVKFIPMERKRWEQEKLILELYQKRCRERRDEYEANVRFQKAFHKLKPWRNHNDCRS